LYYLESNQKSDRLNKDYSHKEKSIVLIQRYTPFIRMMKRFRIIETTIRDQSFFTVEYRTHRFLFFSRWIPIMIGESLEECERKITLIVNLKLSEE
jgi:hypothetical protein